MIAGRSCADWLSSLEARAVPCGPINTIDQVFADPQVLARDMKIAMDHPAAADPIDLIGSPFKLSETPVDHRHPPPMLGEHTEEVLGEWLGLGDGEIAVLRAAGAI